MQFRIGNVQFQGHLGLLRHTPLKHIRHQPSDHSAAPRTLWQQIRLFEIKRMDAGNTGTTTTVRHAHSGLGVLPKELLLQIFGELPGKDLVKVQQVSKRFKLLSNVVISDRKTDGAQEALRKGREFVQELKKGRESVQERISQFSREAGSPKLFKINLEKLIANHRDIGVDMMPGSYFHREHIDILLSVLTKQTHLRSLSIREQQIAKENKGLMERIISTLKTVSSKCKLTELHVSLGSKVTQAQAESLANMPALKSINMGFESQLGYRTLQALLANPATADIHLLIRDKQEGAAEWALVKQALASNKTLEKLSLRGVTDEALAAIAPALEENGSLERLILDTCRPKSHGLQALSTALAHNTSLTALILAHDHIDDAGVAALAPGLEDNRTLRELNLRGNYLTFRGAQALARSLKHNIALTTLVLGWNKIGSAGIEAIADAALTMKNLKHLDMELANGSGGSAMETLRATKPSLRIDL